MPETSEQQEKFRQMTETPVERLVIRLAIPSIISMLISAFYNMADTFFVGQIGTSATGAVGIAFPLMNLIQAFGFFFGHGSGNYIARKLGAHEHESASKMAATGVISSLIVGAAMGCIGLITLDSLARMLGATDTILPYAREYLLYILIATPFMTASLTLNNLLRFQGSSFYGMIGMTSGAVLNVILDPIFIFVLDMGVAGAACATMLSQMVGFFVLLSGCFRKDNIRIRVRNFSPRFSLYKEMFRGGSPSLSRQALASISVIFLNQAAGAFGDAAIAAMTVVSRVTQIATSSLFGFGQGFQPVCGFNYGARQYERVRRAFFFCVKTAVLVLTVIGLACFIGAPALIKVFRNDPEVIRIGSLALRAQCITYPFMAWVVMCNMMTQTMGLAAKANLLAVARQGLFFIPVLFLSSHFLGLLGVQLTQPIADALTLILSIPLGISVLQNLGDKQEAMQKEAEEAKPPTPETVAE